MDKGDEEYEGRTFINDPFTLRHSTSGRFPDAELIFKTQLEQTPEQSDPEGLIQRSLAKRIAFQRF
ncbi:MAG TPA: hypothetical protein VFY40_18035 [Blastocatellia bacterium]|nr:hypothetical protein [Blastocatellia bacterium]